MDLGDPKLEPQDSDQRDANAGIEPSELCLGLDGRACAEQVEALVLQEKAAYPDSFDMYGSCARVP